MKRLKPLLLSLALPSLAVSAPLAAHDGHIMNLTTEQEIALDIYGDIIAFRTAKGHQQVPAMVNYLRARLKAEASPMKTSWSPIMTAKASRRRA